MISIIIPTYNRAYIIQQAIDSVLAQTYQDWELIIVDDGSTDDTESVVKKNKDERIRYIKYSPNQGGNHARNVGMEAAKGEYFAFLDSDAVYVPHKLQVQMDAVRENGSDIVWGQAKFIRLDKTEMIFPEIAASTLNDMNKLLPLSLQEGLINTSTLLIKRFCYEKYGGFDETLKSFQDWDFWWNLLLTQKFKIHFVSDILAINCLQDDSISVDKKGVVKAYCILIQKHLDTFRQYGILSSALDKIFYHWIHGRNISDLVAIKKLYSSLHKEEMVSLICDNFEQIGKQYVQIELLVKNIEKRKLERKLMDWHFPIEKIPDKSRIIIYGAGDVGTSFMKQIAENHWCSVVLWVDRDYQQKGSIVHSPDEIVNCFFDYIVVAISDKMIIPKVVHFLEKLGVPSKKIITISSWEIENKQGGVGDSQH